MSRIRTTSAAVSLPLSRGIPCKLGALLVPVLGAVLPAQTNWTQRTPTTIPQARFEHPLVYDSARDRVVLFGGGAGDINAGPTVYGDTWEWNGSNWINRNPTLAPSARCLHAMAYDSTRGHVVLFGGYDGTSSIADTWEWNGSNWSQRSPATSPPALMGHSMAYDAARDRIVLFGGSVGTYLSAVSHAETWEWDGTNWTQRTPATHPSARSGFGLAYDSARSICALFGGHDGSRLSDTWEWDGSNWTQRSPATSPQARNGLAMTYDSARRRSVVFGGYGAITGTLGDTWEWDGTNWLQRSTANSPPISYFVPMTYDSTRGRCFLFGGWYVGAQNHNFEYEPVNPATFRPFGTACAGSAGTPALAAPGDQRPWIDTNFTVGVTGIPANATVFIGFGISRTVWEAALLPYPLDALGMTGCTLYASCESARTIVASGGVALATTVIPNSTVLVGNQFYSQAMVLDLAANLAGATFTNAMEGRVGAR